MGCHQCGGTARLQYMDSNDQVIESYCECNGRDVNRLDYLKEEEWATKPTPKKRFDSRKAIDQAIASVERRIQMGEFPWIKYMTRKNVSGVTRK